MPIGQIDFLNDALALSTHIFSLAGGVGHSTRLPAAITASWLPTALGAAPLHEKFPADLW